MDELPKSVKVGWRTYRIETYEHRVAVGDRYYGDTSHTNQLIRVDIAYGLKQAAATLFHEIMHAVHRIWQIGDAVDEEKRVEAIEAGIMTVWHDNPVVMEWIGRNLQRTE